MANLVDIYKCNGCGDCQNVCAFDAIEITNSKARIGDACTSCDACVDACKQAAISSEPAAAAAPAQPDEAHGVWVFAEQRNGKLKSVTYELISQGRKLADSLNTELCAVCFGHNVADLEALAHYGVDRVYMSDDPVLADCPEDLLTTQLVNLVRQHKPEILLAGATSLGRSFIPRVATILETGLTADCTGLEIDPDTRLMLQTRPTFGGNLMATITCRARRPQMATVRPRVFKKEPLTSNNHKAQIIKVDFDRQAITSRTKLLSFVESLTEKIKLEDADIIVSGGRGLGKPENFQIIAELAEVLGAALGSSRPPVDEGWIPYPHQVGQTGKTVCPKLYIACGISGAVQHLAGMQTSDIIVAINQDPNAPIFDVATYGIVGDLFEIVPRLTKKLKEIRG